MRSVLLLLGLTTVACGFAQSRTLRVGLLRDKQVKRVIIMTHRGVYDLFADGEKKAQITSTDGLKVEVAERGMVCRTLSASYSAKERIELRPRQADGAFRLKSNDHRMTERSFVGALEITRVSGLLRIVNAAPLEDYVAGVVQSEAGSKQHVEYYKLQAVSCRTYALTNQRKHLPEGFEVCDQVHCQVYKGRNTHDTIAQAVLETKGMVVVDSEIRLIHSTFHSNCGGETLNAEDVWSRPEPYLLATVDPFCVSSAHARWSKRIPRSEWISYLTRTYGVDATSSSQLFPLLEFEPSCRSVYLNATTPLVALKQVRKDWQLNSTYFSVHEQGGEVVIDGRGFGHGVGVCQEGAMAMARKGYSFVDILHFYYADVHLVDLSSLDFFRDLGR